MAPVILFGGVVLLIMMMFRKAEAAPSAPPQLPGEPGPGPKEIPAGPATPGPPGPPLSPRQIGSCQTMIAQAFKRAVAKRKARFAAAEKRESDQSTINATASFFQSRGVPLGKPDPARPPRYCVQSVQAISKHLADTVNAFMPAPLRSSKPTPTVTTVPEKSKIQVVRQAYANAIAYIIDVAYQRRGKRLTAQNVLVPVAQYFALFGIPHPNQLTLANKFWANPLSTIKSKAGQALAYTKQQADIQTGVAPRVA